MRYNTDPLELHHPRTRPGGTRTLRRRAESKTRKAENRPAASARAKQQGEQQRWSAPFWLHNWTPRRAGELIAKGYWEQHAVECAHFEARQLARIAQTRGREFVRRIPNNGLLPFLKGERRDQYSKLLEEMEFLRL